MPVEGGKVAEEEDKPQDGEGESFRVGFTGLKMYWRSNMTNISYAINHSHFQGGDNTLVSHLQQCLCMFVSLLESAPNAVLC